MSPRLSVFADSNIVFSAVLTASNQFSSIWSIPGVELFTSEYVVGEVTRNLKGPESRARLWSLMTRTTLVRDQQWPPLPAGISLPAKDQPILQAAIACKADILVTGDFRHFLPYMDTVIEGVSIESPSKFRSRFPSHFNPGLNSRGTSQT